MLWKPQFCRVSTTYLLMYLVLCVLEALILKGGHNNLNILANATCVVEALILMVSTTNPCPIIKLVLLLGKGLFNFKS